MIDPDATINGPLRTLYLVRQQARLTAGLMPKLRASIEGHWFPNVPEDLRDAIDTVDVYLESIDTMCSRWEPFRIEEDA